MILPGRQGAGTCTGRDLWFRPSATDRFQEAERVGQAIQTTGVLTRGSSYNDTVL